MEPQEIWQVEVNGEVYEAAFEELTEWIAEGSLLPQDRVRRGNLRWIQAIKVPALYGFFNAKELGVSIAPPVSVNSAPIETSVPPHQNSPENFPASRNLTASQTGEPIANTAHTPPAMKSQNFSFADLAETPSPVCLIHTNIDSVYICDGCSNTYCKTCPKSFGGTAKICPMCGAMCKPLALYKQEQEKLNVAESTNDSKNLLSSVKTLSSKMFSKFRKS